MSRTNTTSSKAEGAGPDTRRVTLTGLAAVAIVLTAVLAPMPTDAGGGEPGTGTATPGNGTGGRLPFDLNGTATPGSGTGTPGSSDSGGDGDGRVGTGTGPGQDGTGEVVPACRISLNRSPVPGAVVTVTVTRGSEPLADAPVRFNGDRIGRTSPAGQVTGRVPYDTRLTIRVGLSDGADCLLARESADIGAVSQAAVSEFGRVAPAASGLAVTTPNLTRTYTVQGDVRITITGKAYPGETITVRATVEDVPMRRAVVTVAGERVGRTDRNGTIRVEVPASGADRVTVRVSKGAFDGSRTVDVLRLRVGLLPEGVLLLPGTDATVRAMVGDEPARNAVVEVAGRQRGRTGANGTLEVWLPPDPTATVVVQAAGQTARTSVAAVYWRATPLLMLLAGVLGGTAVAAYRRRGRIGAAMVLGIVVGGVTVLLVEGYVGGRAGWLAAGLLAALVVGGILVRRRRRVATGAGAAASLTARLRAWVVGRLYALVAALERVLDWVAACGSRIQAWFHTLPRSLRGLAGRLLGTIRTGLVSIRHRLRAVSGRAMASGAVAFGLLATGYRWAGLPGAATVVTGVLLIVLGWLAVDGFTTDHKSDDTTTAAGDTGTVTDQTRRDDRSLRWLWRRFASRVVPGCWQTRTPGEVAQAAREQGYPQEAVADLTRLFREVEYGDREVSGAVRERANDAYARLTAADRPPKRRDPEDREVGP